MLYCYDERVPLESYSREIELVKSKGQAIFYNDIDGFKDSYGNKIDIKDKVILSRTFVAQVSQINKAIEINGGLLITTEAEDEVLDSWPKYYKPKRNAIILTGEDLINEDVILELQKVFGEKLFIKTKEKNFNGIIPVSLLKDRECNFYRALTNHLGTDFIVSRSVDILEDQHGLREYRCVVLNDQVANISRYTENVLHEIDSDVLASAQRIVESVKGIMPSYYVVDLFEYEVDGRKEIDVVEFNPIQTSGVYLYNSVVEVSDDILHSDKKRLPYEYSDRLDECVYDDTMINERNPLYRVPKSFANDLMSICLSGDIGMGFFFDVSITEEDYAKHGSKFGGGSFTEITDDSALTGRRIMSDADLFDGPKFEFKPDKKGE